MGELYDAPNQQVVRADGSGPWDEGTGGSTPSQAQATPEQEGEGQGERQVADQETGRAPEKPAARRKTGDREGPPR